MTVGIRASVATCGSNLEDTMASSQIERIVEKVCGRDVDPVAIKGRGKKDKSRDPMASLEGRVTRLEVAMADTKEGVDLFGAKHGEGRGGSQGVDPRPSRGHARLAGPSGVA